MDIKELIRNPETTFLDVRSPEECAAGMIEGAVNIPLNEIPFRLDEVKEMATPIVCYCRSGARSAQAAMWLTQNGIEAYNGGGISDVYFVKINAHV
jgi:rhodanese-related sulfurtransferase